MKIFNKILVANRGEIAVRVIKTMKKLGINSVAIYSEKDRNALHCRIADEAYKVNGDTLGETYLNIEKIIEITRESGADAIHPGYGFLSENARFSQSVADAGLNFIGPPGEVINAMGNKLQARSLARKAGLPLIEGFEGKAEDLIENIDNLEFPVILKAAAGGGGKAMRIVKNAGEFREALEITRREAMNYFADDTLYAEKYFEKGRHIEVQVLADHYGNIIIPGERECSIQRRYQKVIEETPSIFLNSETRSRMFETSKKLVREISYVNAGTIEYLVDENQHFYFLEMNTRIQVEHPVTEETTGLDLVEQQIYIAAGNELQISQEEISVSNHSIQARLYAEDPAKNFLPSPGKIHHYSEPSFPGLRIDSGINSAGEIFPDFDPLISKIIATASSREEATSLLCRTLRNYSVAGVITNREFLLNLMDDEDFIQNRVSTTWLEKTRNRILNKQKARREEINKEVIFAAWLAKNLFTSSGRCDDPWHIVGYWRHQVRKSFSYEGKQYDIYVNERKKNSFTMIFNERQYDIQLRSLNENKIMFLLDGSWNCAKVVSGEDIEDIVIVNGYEYRIKPLDYLPELPFIKDSYANSTAGPWIIKSPLHGRIVKLNALLNTKVSKGQLLFTLDAMKMENRITSPFDGCVKEVRIKEGEQVSINQEILIIDGCNGNNQT